MTNSEERLDEFWAYMDEEDYDYEERRTAFAKKWDSTMARRIREYQLEKWKRSTCLLIGIPVDAVHVTANEDEFLMKLPNGETLVHNTETGDDDIEEYRIYRETEQTIYINRDLPSVVRAREFLRLKNLAAQ